MKSLSVFMYFGLVVLVKSELDPDYINIKKSDRDGQINKTDNNSTKLPFLVGDVQCSLCNATLKTIRTLEELDNSFDVSGEFRGRNCLKNVTKCMQEGRSFHTEILVLQYLTIIK